MGEYVIGFYDFGFVVMFYICCCQQVVDGGVQYGYGFVQLGFFFQGIFVYWIGDDYVWFMQLDVVFGYVFLFGCVVIGGWEVMC